jgi:hypothetical protein
MDVVSRSFLALGRSGDAQRSAGEARGGATMKRLVVHHITPPTLMTPCTHTSEDLGRVVTADETLRLKLK